MNYHEFRNAVATALREKRGVAVPANFTDRDLVAAICRLPLANSAHPAPKQAAPERQREINDGLNKLEIAVSQLQAANPTTPIAALRRLALKLNPDLATAITLRGDDVPAEGVVTTVSDFANSPSEFSQMPVATLRAVYGDELTAEMEKNGGDVIKAHASLRLKKPALMKAIARQNPIENGTDDGVMTLGTVPVPSPENLRAMGLSEDTSFEDFASCVKANGGQVEPLNAEIVFDCLVKRAPGYTAEDKQASVAEKHPNLVDKLPKETAIKVLRNRKPQPAAPANPFMPK